MTDNPITLPRAEVNTLLGCADGTAALLYLLQRCDGVRSRTEAARTLKCAPEELDRAAETLRRLGLLSAPERPPESRELPEYSGEDISARAKSDSAFEGVVFEAQRALGRILSGNDLRILFGIYDHLGMPAEVIMLLLNHCIDEAERKYGPGRKPTMRFVEKEAWDWAELEVLTAESAEAHIERVRAGHEAAAQVQAALQLRGRALSPTEARYIKSWLDMGFGPEAVAEAYDRTVISTGKLNWRYLDRILQSWHGSGFHTPEEIAAGDPPRRGGGGAPAASARAGDVDDMRDLRGLYARLKGGED